MKKILLLSILLLVRACAAQAPANFEAITAAQIHSGSSSLLSSGSIIFQAVGNNQQPISYQIGGGGQQISWPTICSIANGAITGSCQVANTALTNPVNVCFSVTVKNAFNQVVLGGPGQGYQCVQPATSTSWCSNGTCNFDQYTPNTNGIPTAILPLPTPLNLGGVFSAQCPTNFLSNGNLATGQPSCVPSPTLGSAVWGGISGNLLNQADLSAALALLATVNSPTFTGTPVAPTQTGSDSSTKLATTAFVKGQSYAPLSSPALTGTPTAPTPATVDSSTKLATTAWVAAQGFGTGTGNVSGPVSSTANNVAIFNSTNGRTINDSGISFPLARANLGTLAAGSNGLVASATTDTTNASNISSGTLAAARVAQLNQNTTGTAGGLNGVQTASLATGILKNTTTTGVPSIAVAGDFPTLNQSTTGNAATATALATGPSQCAGGQFSTGVAANGNANCGTPAGSGNVSTSGTITSGQIALWASTTGVKSVAMTGDGTFSNTGLFTATGLNGVTLSSLSTGIVKNTTGTGAPSIAVAGDFPTLNQNTTGTASNLSGTPALPSGTTATTQTAGDNTTKLATTAFVLANSGSTLTVNGGGAISAPNLVNGTGTTVVPTSNNVAVNLAPSAVGVIGGVKAFTPVSHQFLTGVDTTGAHSAAQPACADLSNSSPSCSTDTTNAANITSGALPAARVTATAISGFTSNFFPTFNSSGNLVNSPFFMSAGVFTGNTQMLNTVPDLAGVRGVLYTDTSNGPISNDRTINLGCDTGASPASWHFCLDARIQGVEQMQIGEQPGPQGETVFGSAVPFLSINQSPFAKVVMQSATAGHNVLRLYQNSTSATGIMLELNNATAAGTGWYFIKPCAGATGSDTGCGAGTNPFSIRGDGLFTSAVGFTTSGATATGTLQATGISGSVQCIHADAAGNLTGTGVDCGAGSGPTLGTPAQIPVMNAGATAYTPQSISGDFTLTTGGIGTVASLHLPTPTSGALTSENSSGNILASAFTDISNQGAYSGTNGFQGLGLYSVQAGGSQFGGSQGLALSPIANGFAFQLPDTVANGFNTIVPNAPSTGIWQTSIVVTGPAATGVLTSGAVTSTTAFAAGTASSSLGYPHAPPCAPSGGTPSTPAACHWTMTGSYPNFIPSAIVIDAGGAGYGSTPSFGIPAGGEQSLLAVTDVVESNVTPVVNAFPKWLATLSPSGENKVGNSNATENGTAFLPNNLVDLKQGNSISAEVATADASYTSGNLACITATATVGNCPTGAANPTFIGVLEPKNGSAPVYAMNGQISANSSASASFTQNDIVCTDLTNAGKVIDNGTVPCPQPQKQVGVVLTTDSAVTAHVIQILYAPSIPFSPAVVTIGSGTSIGTTSWCSTTQCPAGLYKLTVYVDVTTPCTTTGSYTVSYTYTDDGGSKNAVAFPLTGTGVTTNSLALASANNFAQGVVTVRTTGVNPIQYATTAGACGTGGPAVGKMYLTAERIQWQ